MTDDRRPVALVTGSSRGIGRAVAEHLLGRDWRVVGCSRGDSDLEVSDYSHVACDVTDEAAVKSLLRETKKRHPAAGGVHPGANSLHPRCCRSGSPGWRRCAG